MNCNTGQHKVFADDVIASLQEVLKKYGLDEVVVHRESNPVLVAARGSLGGEDEQRGRVELVLQISPNLEAAEKLSQEMASPVAQVPGPVARAFDLSEMVARETMAAASPETEDRWVKPNHGSTRPSHL